MKLEVEKKDLINLISKTQNIVEKRNTMPVLVNVLLEAHESQLKVFATDLEVSLTNQVAAQIKEEGKVAVNAKSLFEIIKELAEDKIQLIKKPNNWLQIQQKGYTSKIVGISHEEYPIFPTFSGDEFLNIEADILKEMIDKTLYSVSLDETRYHLNGVYFEQIHKNKIPHYRMVATDGHRLSLVEKEASGESLKMSDGVIIPRKGLYELKKLLELIDGQVNMAIEGSQLIVKHEATVLMIRLIEGKYPNYQQLIPQKLNHQILVSRDNFLTSLKRVIPLANQKSKGITFNLSNGKLEISSNNPELGDAKSELEISYSGDEMKIGFNAKYLTDILSSMNDELIDFQLSDQLSPGIIKPHNDDTYTCVVMPMRI